jgi:hypothetical protein
MRDVSSDEESPTHTQLETQQQESCNYATERDTYHEIEVFHENDAKETDNVASLSNAAVVESRSYATWPSAKHTLRPPIGQLTSARRLAASCTPALVDRTTIIQLHILISCGSGTPAAHGSEQQHPSCWRRRRRDERRREHQQEGRR